MAPHRLTSALLTSLLATILTAGTTDAALLDVPSPKNYVRRALARAIVLNNHVYIEGGQITQYEDGFSSIRGRVENQVNSTLSIPLNESWKSESVTIKATPKPFESLARNRWYLWTDTKNGVFYAWGGYWPFGLEMVTDEVYKFTADSRGGGEWGVETLPNGVRLDQISPGEAGAVTSTGTMGIVIGGQATPWTQLGRDNTRQLSGMITFDFESKALMNGTQKFSPFGDTPVVGASAEFISGVGENGIVIVMGGHVGRTDKEVPLGEMDFFDMRNVTFFDPVTKETWSQVTTGDIPPSPRIGFCTAAFSSKEGGHEIFIFGGSNERDYLVYEDAYVLSLPGFVWTKLPTPPGGRRAYHTCVAVGNRQVLSVGGRGREDEIRIQDAIPQGLLLFDMTAIEWKLEYDSNAAAYESANAIKDWYEKRTSSDVQWSSEGVEQLFATSAEALFTSGDSSDSQSDSNTDSPSGPTTTTMPDISAPAGLSTGAMVGIILAAVICLAAIIGGWLFWRRRRAGRHNALTEIDDLGELGVDGAVDRKELASESHVREMPSDAQVEELPTKFQDTKVPVAHYHEVDGGHDYAELPTYHRPRPRASQNTLPPVELDAGYTERELM
ncbi:uncharacterized protein QC763_213470 [Podospora pseudopauciseta]|uniref:Kelch repeat-containing protein n=1 Tax=Podospora pseudopauciseta TaxID=2093780 RepID=A0ABR0HRV2_9PEZI|nr:hypothetical protein QC763_213470 [Podospora pseudopauciseta]